MGLPKAYVAGDYEADIYALWEKSGVFIADPSSSKPHFSIAMPPPNETSTLHLGGALFITLQDILIRHARQVGYDALWLPGTDHAAIATNSVVERQLAEQGTNKHELGREAFVAKVKEFADRNRGTMLKQMRAMGASADWSRLRYTLDEALNRCVNEVFIKMYQDGLIYRGHRIVNWDPNLETTVSDDEVIYKEEESPLYTLQYGPFKISTARPETKFGDKYVVMHPGDKRYAQYKTGDTFECEWINGPVTATIIKDEAVDPAFGTGVMTITPWHDRTDFEIAERHGLEKEQIIDFDGKLLAIAGEFEAIKIDEARPKIVEKLRQKNLLVSIDKTYTHNIALNSRGKGVIEPQIKLQWFIDVNRPAVDWKGQKRSLKEVMRAVIEDGDIKIVPKRFEKIYYHWIDNLRDWCISRQIWWGHQIPVWYRQESVHSPQSAVHSKDSVYVGVRPPQEEGWQQDPDTLDTWFSSALWTWSTLVDPELTKDFSLSLDDLLAKSIDYQTYHPTDVLETAYEILFFWVARMILATTYVTGRVPFKTVYLHGLVRTETGKKMSKSDPDSIVDPVGVINEYGTDALRLALIAGTSPGTDQRVRKSKIVANRNFVNKLWNIARYIDDLRVRPLEGEENNIGRRSLRVVPLGHNRGSVMPKSVADHWILNKLSIAARAVSEDLDNFRFSEAYDALYHFVWDDFADWYVEVSKTTPNREVLAFVLKSTLKIAHPFAPFVTETIWQSFDPFDKTQPSINTKAALNSSNGQDRPEQGRMGDSAQDKNLFQGLALEKESLLASQLWPKFQKVDLAKVSQFKELQEIITQSRQIAANVGVTKPALFYKAAPLIDENKELVKSLGRLSQVKEAKAAKGLRLTGTKYAAWLDIDRETAQAYLGRLKTSQKAREAAIKLLQKRLSNKSYTQKAPKELVKQTKTQLVEEQQLLEAIKHEIAAFQTAVKNI
ncbi:valine--tRNA ligase [Candidatus Saccharibacteria bacterium]|nr:valine--tRNA ligase [Candidatus Saccharibacteria bacterium]